MSLSRRILILTMAALLGACASLPSLPGHIRWVDQEEARQEEAPEDSQTAEQVSANWELLKQHWSEGTRLFGEAEWRPAIAEFSAALQLAPENARILVARGWAHAKVGEERLALNDFRQALRHEQLAEAHIGIAELAKAALPHRDRRSEVWSIFGTGWSHYKQAIRMRPNDEYLYYGLATLQYMFHHHPSASPPLALRYPLAEVRRAIEQRPDFAEAHMLEAMIRSEIGDDEAEAARAAERAIALQPRNPEAHYVRGLVMSRTRNRPQAVAYARKALELDPSNARYARAIREWQRPPPPTWGQLAGLLSGALLGAFLTVDSGPYTGPANAPSDPWGPNGYLKRWNMDITMRIK